MDARAAAIEPLKVNVNNAHASALKDMLAAGYPVREAEAKAAQVSEKNREVGMFLSRPSSQLQTITRSWELFVRRLIYFSSKL